MIIFGNRAHYSAIGGVENSIRNLLLTASKMQLPAISVCRNPIKNEALDASSVGLPENIQQINYDDDTLFSLPKRLLNLRRGGVALPQLYRRLHVQYPHAIVIARHHSHVLAARTAGFENIRYLLPSLIKNQLSAEMKNADYRYKLRIFVHLIIDSYLQNRAILNSKRFVFSSSMILQIRQILPKRYHSIPIEIVKPGIDANRFKVAVKKDKDQLRRQLGLPSAQNLFLFVGRFVQAKGIDFLVAAIAQMPSNCSAILVGEGEQEETIKRKISALNLENRVILAGRTSHVEDFYRACDVFVMSSTYEPLGQTILEAAACGMRVVAFSKMTGVVTATHELDLDYTIDYAKTLSSKGLSEAMAVALQKTSRVHAKKNSISCQRRYSWSFLLEQLRS